VGPASARGRSAPKGPHLRNLGNRWSCYRHRRGPSCYQRLVLVCTLGWGALFFYCLADAVEGGVRALYRAAGVVVPRQQLVPIASRSVQEFWGKRWNRAVGAWLRAHCFLPFARRGQVRTGLVAAFSASAVFHAYFTLVAVGWTMALAMTVFFLVQGAFVLVELRVGVARWRPALAHAWTIVGVLGCSPLFIEPILRILLGEM